MPNRKAAIKDLRTSARRTERNKKIKDNLKTVIKKSLKAIEAKDVTAKELVIKASKAIDKAAKTGLIKKNTASRRKSRLDRNLNKLAAKK
ncbi:MAG: 30S ribosomal protein S20 [bacterium]